ncbi:vWA domain-containing protein [Pseudoalteromonas denitrificans]|uniref:Ca-activated chloride channel family protein n=1 Tax=Pseudoalteromonas denitrificans DSM 6059 TaxID=1123010 RepID=A0A1I1FDC0_9GAMM|nr:VWA domain-containing protein [Pseudoalteromonas denitrificans]SFB97365.1 Ca-activated chloride channel family protein [Pseudoalteromonas denitrificans DSM 6059]
MKTHFSKSIIISSLAFTVLAGCSPQTKQQDKSHDITLKSKKEVSQKRTVNEKVNDSSQLQSNVKTETKMMAGPKSKLMRTVAPTAFNSYMLKPPQFIHPQSPVASNTEKYLDTPENALKFTNIEPVSTFSIDVDTGSYSNTRRMINMGKLPPSNAVRAEEFINYFDYKYQAPIRIETPFNIYTELAPAPWDDNRQLLKIGLKGFEIEKSALKAANLVFLLDVSGSMNSENKLPLLKRSLLMLTKQLDENDTVSIVVYAGAAGVVLKPTKGNDHHSISHALNQLQAGGATNGQSGIELAYSLAEQNFKKEGVNRVVLATDGDFNVGLNSINALKDLIKNKRKSGIALTTLGFGRGNYNDALMEQLADIGNGHHAYIDNINEARKVLVDEIASTMQIIAKDVKIQVEFNPDQVAEYRLIGYQNRLLKQEDFNNDKVDAAEMGAGHTVTALYEITLTDSKNKRVDDLRYQDQKLKKAKLKSNELAFIKLRFKKPNSDTSQLLTHIVNRTDLFLNIKEASLSFGFSAAVAGFAQLLKDGKYTAKFTYQDVIELAKLNKGQDDFGYRAEFIQLVRTAQAL